MSLASRVTSVLLHYVVQVAVLIALPRGAAYPLVKKRLVL